MCKTEAGVQPKGLGVSVLLAYGAYCSWLLLVAACVWSLVPATVFSLSQRVRARIKEQVAGKMSGLAAAA